MDYNKKIFNFKSAFFIAALFLFSIFYVIYSVPRADAAGIVISPLTFEINANPGETITNVMRIFNSEDSAVIVNVEVEDFAPRGEEGQVVVTQGFEASYSLKSWVTLEPSTFSVEPKQSQLVTFTINIPFNAEPGGHYGSILASVGGGAGAGAVGIAQKIGSLLLLNIAGPVEEQLWVKTMEPIRLNEKGEEIPLGFMEYGPVTLRTRFENTGTVHLKPAGFILVKDMFGREVDRENLEQLNVLPNSIRRFDTEMGQRLMIGKYTATLTAIYGTTNEPLTFTTSFWVFPWKIGGAIAFGILLLLWFMFKARKRLKIAFRVLFRGK